MKRRQLSAVTHKRRGEEATGYFWIPCCADQCHTSIGGTRQLEARRYVTQRCLVYSIFFCSYCCYCVSLFVRQFVGWCTRSFIILFIPPSIGSFAYLFVCSFVRSSSSDAGVHNCNFGSPGLTLGQITALGEFLSEYREFTSREFDRHHRDVTLTHLSTCPCGLRIRQ